MWDLTYALGVEIGDPDLFVGPRTCGFPVRAVTFQSIEHEHEGDPLPDRDRVRDGHGSLQGLTQRSPGNRAKSASVV